MGLLKFLGMLGWSVSEYLALRYNLWLYFRISVFYSLSLSFSWICGIRWEKLMGLMKSQFFRQFGLVWRLIPLMRFLKSRFEDWSGQLQFWVAMASNLHRPSRRFRDDERVRKNQKDRRPVCRNLDFQDPMLPASAGDVRVSVVDNGSVRDSRENDRISQGNIGVAGFNFGRGYGRVGSGSRGRCGYYRGGSRSGQGDSFRRKDDGSGSNDSVWESGLVSETMVPVDRVSVSELAGDGLFFFAVPFRNEGGESSQIITRCEAASDLQSGANGKLVDEFDGEFDFGVADEFGEENGDEELYFQDDVMNGKLEDVDKGRDDDVIPFVAIMTDSSAVEKISKTGVMTPENSETERSTFMGDEVAVTVVSLDGGSMKKPLVGKIFPGDEIIDSKEKEVWKSDSVNDTAFDQDLGAKKDGKEKQVRDSGILVGVNSKKRNVALLASPSRKELPKSGVGVKIGGKDKDGKVALPKLPGGP